jgi:hypothetical protein
MVEYTPIITLLYPRDSPHDVFYQDWKSTLPMLTEPGYAEGDCGAVPLFYFFLHLGPRLPQKIQHMIWEFATRGSVSVRGRNSFPLFPSLPPEIRNIIWEFAAGDMRQIHAPHIRINKETHRCVSKESCSILCGNLTQRSTCRLPSLYGSPVRINPRHDIIFLDGVSQCYCNITTLYNTVLVNWKALRDLIPFINRLEPRIAKVKTIQVVAGYYSVSASSRTFTVDLDNQRDIAAWLQSLPIERKHDGWKFVMDLRLCSWQFPFLNGEVIEMKRGTGASKLRFRFRDIVFKNEGRLYSGHALKFRRHYHSAWKVIMPWEEYKEFIGSIGKLQLEFQRVIVVSVA